MKDVYHILGLEGSPFSPATSRQGYFRTEQSAQILQELCFGVTSRKGFVLLLGEVGVGKTSLLLQLLKELEGVKGLTSAWVFNTAVSRSGLLSAVIADLGLAVTRGATVAEMIGTLHEHFLKVNESGGNCVIVIDEAHNLSIQALEALRMLSNLESGGQKLVQILLAGQPELDACLDRPDLRQLRSRIYIHRTLQPLSRQEVREYVSFKLSAANKPIALKDSAFRLLWSATRGNLRMIHLVMDRVLHGLVVHRSRRITPGIMDEALKELAGHQRFLQHRLRQRRRRRIGLGLAAGLAGLCLVALLGGITKQRLQAARQAVSLAADLPLLGLPEPGEVKDAADTAPAASRKAGQGSRTGATREGIMQRYAVQERYRAAPTMAAPQKPEAADKPKRQSREALVRFLGPFGLQELLPQLQRAVETGRVSIFERALPKGLAVVQATSLPQQRGLHFTSLPWRALSGSGLEWLLLWRPPLQMDSTEPTASNRVDILILQRMLQELGHYKAKLDGKYGRKTHRALQDFQREAGLAGSAGPDAKTIFKLCRAYEKGH